MLSLSSVFLLNLLIGKNCFPYIMVECSYRTVLKCTDLFFFYWWQALERVLFKNAKEIKYPVINHNLFTSPMSIWHPPNNARVSNRTIIFLHSFVLASCADDCSPFFWHQLTQEVKFRQRLSKWMPIFDIRRQANIGLKNR